MNYENYFKDLLESLPDYRKTVLLLHVIQDDDDFLRECGLLKCDITRLNKKIKTILIEQNEEYLHHIKNEEESIIEKILNK